MGAKYIEIFNELVNQINDGTLKGNEKLPSKRNMAIKYNVSINTIINAYNLLLDEGYIYSIEKKGYFVEQQLVVNHTPKYVENEIIRENKYNYDFTTQKMDRFESTNWNKIIRNELSNGQYLNKTESLGDLGLRTAIQAHLIENRGIHAPVENIIIGSGLEMLERIIQTINIKHLSMENPGYHKLKDIAINNQITYDYLPLDENGVIPPQNQTILYSTPFNQFPTGIKMSIARKKELVKFADETKSYIIEDDFDAEFRIQATPSVSLYQLNPYRVIFFSTFTETIFPGLRISYAIVPNDIIQIYKTKYKNYSTTVPTLEQLALKEFIKEGFYESHINRAKKKYIERRNLILKAFENNSKFICDAKKNYLSILVQINTDHTDKEIKKILEDNKIHINLISDFDAENTNSHTLILGYTAMSNDALLAGIEAIKKIL